jgi:short-subunit dehydrogenase
MSKQVVVITGALTGVGSDDAGQFAAELRALGAEAEFVRADIRREDDVRNLVDKTV